MKGIDTPSIALFPRLRNPKHFVFKNYKLYKFHYIQSHKHKYTHKPNQE